MLKTAVAVLMLGLLYACGNTEHRAEKRFSGGWAFADSLQMDYTCAEAGTQRRLMLDLDIDDGYRNSNIHLRFRTRMPNGQTSVSHTEFILADSAGKWHVEPERGVLSFRTALVPRLVLPQAGQYQIGVAQFMRDDTLQHVRRVALRLEKL